MSLEPTASNETAEGPRAPYRVRLTDVFEGPMDLLVHLIKKNEIAVTDIPIALITEQYLAYLEFLDAMNVDYAGEFVVMASTLLQIKSRMLLPLHAEEGGEEEDPRQEIVRPLVEYLRLKSAAEQLAKRPLLGEDTFTRTAKNSAAADLAAEAEIVKIGLFELIDAFQRILAGLPEDRRLEFTADTLSVQDRMTQIADALEERGSLTFEELFPAQPTRADIVVTFLALLEMVKLGLIRLAQHVPSGIIRIFYL